MRPITLSEFVTQLEPGFAGLTDEDLEGRWCHDACRSLVARAADLAVDPLAVGRCTFEMLKQSVIRLQMAQEACDPLSHMLLSGVQSIVVAGSVARGEAVLFGTLNRPDPSVTNARFAENFRHSSIFT